MSLMASAFATVFLRVFQPQNVTHRQYTLAALTSALITLTPLALIQGLADGSRVKRIVGGRLGVLASMKSHEGMIRWFARKNTTGNPSQGDAKGISVGWPLKMAQISRRIPCRQAKTQPRRQAHEYHHRCE